MMRQLDAKIFCGLVFSDSTYTVLHKYTQGVFWGAGNPSHIDTKLKTLEMFRRQPDSHLPYARHYKPRFVYLVPNF